MLVTFSDCIRRRCVTLQTAPNIGAGHGRHQWNSVTISQLATEGASGWPSDGPLCPLGWVCLAKTRSAATDVSVMVTTTANQWAGACVCSPESHRGLLPANRELAANPGGQISATVARLSTGCLSGGEARVAVVQTTDFWALDESPWRRRQMSTRTGPRSSGARDATRDREAQST